MRAVVQRVERAHVSVDGEIVGAVGNGLLVLLAVTHKDTETDADYLLEKIINLRVFPDEAGKMNRSMLDYSGELLVISQFTLYGDCRRGRRPSFTDAAAPAHAEKLYNYFLEQSRTAGVKTEAGVFQAMMAVELVNDGPVTILLDSGKLF